MKSPADYFNNPANFQAALVHRSYCNEHLGIPSNERLEFLGDAVLSLIISDRLYRMFPELPEGELTSRRSYLVQTSSLAAKSKLLGLDQQLLLSRGEEDSGGRSNTSLLANTFEAVLGALFLDSGIASCYVYISHVFPDEELTAQTQTKDPKSLLQEQSQAHGWGTPIYKTLSASGPDHAKHFVLGVIVNGKEVAQGSGTSKQRAETEAAKMALDKLFP
jgi:ribonuclease III